jgi:acyl-CoA thioester hydrolase
MALPVVEAHCAYHRPARYEDLLDIDIRIGRLRGASMTFVYQVRRGPDKIASGWTEHACIDPATGRPKRFPAPFLALIGGEV